MSIIERVSDLLGSSEWPSRPEPPRGESIRTTAMESIERSLRQIPDGADSDPTRRLAGQSESGELSENLKRLTDPSPAAATGLPRIQLNRDHLRRQSMIVPEGDRSPVAENFRRIKRKILANVSGATLGTPTNLVLVTSSRAGEGKTFCATNLAISIAMERDYKVLLVDADVAKRSVPRVLGIRPEVGLMDWLVSDQVQISDVMQETDIKNLTILQSGTAHQHATELLASEKMRLFLREVAGRYANRIIIFDSPPLLAASEASVLASQMGQIVMVVESGKTPMSVLKAA